jgi:glycosyltransferase involved in cell wall biosynthesis
LTRGGAERQLATLAIELNRRGFEPTVFCLSSLIEPFGAVLRSAGIAVQMLERLGPFDPTRVVRLARGLRRREIDLVHSFLIDVNLYTLLAAKLSGIGAVVTSNLLSDFRRDPLRRRLDRLAFLGAGRVWVNSERAARFTSEYFNVPSERIVAIRQGVDTDRFRPADREAARRRLGIPRGLVLGTVASLREQKAPGLFLDIACALLRERPDLTVLHVGEGSLREAVEARLAKEPDARRFLLLGARDDVDQILPALDLFVLNSLYEGLPNAILEAMACGLPVVASDIGGCRELVRVGECGLLAPPGSPEGFVAACRSLLEDSTQREAMGKEARRLAVEEHSLARMTERMLALYEAAGLRAGPTRTAIASS